MSNHHIREIAADKKTVDTVFHSQTPIDNTYIFMKNEDTGKSDDIEVEVGDVKQPGFKPCVKLKRWDNEVNFSVGIITDHKGKDTEKDGKVEWDDEHGVKARFYEKGSDEFEFEIELASKPVSNTIELSIETKGLDFFYQPELTKEEIDAGHERPEDIVGSYAVYHSTKQGDYSQIGGKNYQAGKVFHIYRPKIIDMSGKEVWGNLHIDTKKKLLTIEVPQEFLDTTVYPVIIDPTFGYTTIGGSGAVATSDYLLGSLFTGAAGIGIAITAHLWGEGGHDGKFALYKHSDSTKITNGETAAITPPAAWGWRTGYFGVFPIVEAIDYVVAFGFDAAAEPHRMVMNYDIGDANQGHNEAITYPTLPATASFSHNNYKYSIFCTYCSIIPIVMHHLRQQGIS